MSKENLRMSRSHPANRISQLKRVLKRSSIGAVALGCLLLVSAAAPASAEVRLAVEARWGPTHLPPGGVGQFYFNVRNVGTTATSGQIVLKNHLPPGVTATHIDGGGTGHPSDTGWSCFGTHTVTCVINEEIGPDRLGASADDRGYVRSRVQIAVAVAPGASLRTNTAIVSGGGAGSCPGPGSPCQDTDLVTVSDVPAGRGFVPASFTSDVFDAAWPEGEHVRQAGTHPFEMRVDFDFNLTKETSPATGNVSTGVDGYVRTIETILPVGTIGNPESTPKCRQQDFLTVGSSGNTTACPPETQVGILNVELGGTQGFSIWGNPAAIKKIPVYNLAPPKGVPADFGFAVAGTVIGHIYSSVDPSHNYSIKATTPYISDLYPVRMVRFTAWGVPADPAHDRLRSYPELQPNGDAFGASSTALIRPLLTTPMDCGVDNGPFRQRMDTWQDPESFTPLLDAPSHLITTGCDDPRFRFEPGITLQPTSASAGGPTGLDVHLKVPQRDQLVDDFDKLYAENGNVHGIDTPPMKKVVVRFPEGMTLSTSAAQGLGTCSPEQIGLGTNDPVTCPDSSQYGTLTMHTPILPKDAPMTGFIYLAEQNKNPFGNFLSMYLVIEEPERGLRVKIPGRIDLDPVTGRIVTTFDDLPQFPVSDMQLTFKGGVRAGLVNPTTCGTKAIAAEFFSWADPTTPHTVTDSYQVTQRPDGSPCVNHLADRPFAAQMNAGTLNPNAGAYSPFIFRMTRTDDDQELSQIGVHLPAGLTSRIADLTLCPDAAIEAAADPIRTGRSELASPSCPASSQLGTSDVGSGVGVPLSYFPGKVYLAGPYRGAPLSMAVITPAVVGPYDLGVIAVRSAIDLDPVTAEIDVLTEPFPQIYQGIPVRIRDIRLKLDRPGTMRNPTNCDPKTIDAHLTGAGGNVNSTADDTATDLSNRFQVANCSALGFKPRFAFRLKGGTERSDHPALQVTLRTRPGDANMRKVVVTLPRAQFLDQSHINTVCTRVQFKADECPPGSIYGYAKAFSPLLAEPLAGPVYLRSSSNRLPDLVMALDGIIDVEVPGRIDSLKGRLRSTFETIPDQPISKFVLTMKGGSKGLLVNSTDLCKNSSANRVSVSVDGQSGKTADHEPLLQNSCPKVRKAAKRHKRPASTRKAG